MFVAARIRAVRAEGVAPADALERTVLEDTEELRLQRRVEVTDLVEEKRPGRGELEAALAPAARAGERALLVAEELALEERGG